MDDFGGKLRQARERRGISLRQIAASTKISAAALEALERNDISKLPGGIFSRAFVKSYAAEVGLDPDKTVEEFLARFNQEAPPTAESIASSVPEVEIEFESRQRTAGRLLKIALIAIPVLSLLGYFAWKGRVAARQQNVLPAAAPIAAPEPSPSVVPPPAPVPDAGAPSAPAVAQLTLELRPTADCWVSLTVDDRKVFERMMPAGERQTHVVSREAIVEVGDAGAFAFAINGREGKPLGTRGQLKTLRLTPETASQYIR